MEPDTVEAEEIHFKATPDQDQYNLEVFVTKKLSEFTEERLLLHVFGEEVRLKKLKTVRFIVKKGSIMGAMDVKDIRRFMGVRTDE